MVAETKPPHDSGHMRQYAVVGSRATFVGHTENLTDDEVRARAAALRKIGVRRFEVVDRFNRCPACEVWTTEGGRLRRNLDCPALKEETA